MNMEPIPMFAWSKAVIPSLGYADPQGYEPGHLGIREKIE
jgi:hypothetical protein